MNGLPPLVIISEMWHYKRKKAQEENDGFYRGSEKAWIF